MTEKSSLLIHGITKKHKDFLYHYANEILGSSSRTKAVLHLINEKMQGNESIFLQEISNDTKSKRERVQITLRPKHYQQVEEIAKKTDTSKQHYIISLILKDLDNVDRLNGEQIAELRKSNYQLHKIGVNINQIAKALNEKRDIKIDERKLNEDLKFISMHIDIIKTLLRNSMIRY